MVSEIEKKAIAKGTDAPSVSPSVGSQRKNEIEEFYIGLSEGTYFKSAYVKDSYEPPYNPDDLWKKRGNFSIYEDMTNDDQVSVCLQFKKDLVLGDGGHFVSGEDGQEEILEDLETAFFEDYEGEFITDVEQICTAYEFGFSLTEKVFKLREGGRIGPRYLRTRHPDSWRIHQDTKGKVTRYEQITDMGSINVEPKSLIHYVNTPRFQNPYGKSDLRAAYAAYFTKLQVFRYMGIFLEKAASPVPVARYDKNAPKEAITEIFNIIKKFQSKTALTIPRDIEVEFLEAKNSGEAYIVAQKFLNMCIGRSMLVPDLVGFTGPEVGGGSYSLGKEQMQLFFKHIIRRRQNLESLINNHLVRPTVVYNHGFVKKFPKFKFKPIDDMQAVELAKVWLEAVKGKTYKPNHEEINYFRKLLKFPEGDVEYIEQQPFNPDDPFGRSKNQDPRQLKYKQVKGDKEEKKEFKLYNIPDGDYHKKCDYKAIENKLNDYDDSLLNETSLIVKKMIDDLVDQVEKKKIVQNQNLDRIDTLKLKHKKDLQVALKSSMNQLFRDAQTQAAREIEKVNFAKPLESLKFLEAIEKETFNFVGDYEYTILKYVRNELISAIKDGRPLSDVTNILTDELRSLSDVQIERFARTKHTEVLNNGRVEYFESTGVVQGYQYSAILDGRTSDICRGLHGKKFKAGEEPIPPLHFNCRSLLIPITIYEQFKPSDRARGMPIKEFIEAHKGKGFSTK